MPVQSEDPVSGAKQPWDLWADALCEWGDALLQETARTMVWVQGEPVSSRSRGVICAPSWSPLQDVLLPSGPQRPSHHRDVWEIPGRGWPLKTLSSLRALDTRKFLAGPSTCRTLWCPQPGRAAQKRPGREEAGGREEWGRYPGRDDETGVSGLLRLAVPTTSGPSAGPGWLSCAVLGCPAASSRRPAGSEAAPSGVQAPEAWASSPLQDALPRG